MEGFEQLFRRIEKYIEGLIKDIEMKKDERLELLKSLANIGAYSGLLKRIGLEKKDNGIFYDWKTHEFYKFRPAIVNTGSNTPLNEIIKGYPTNRGFKEEESIFVRMIEYFLNDYKIEKDKAPGGI